MRDSSARRRRECSTPHKDPALLALTLLALGTVALASGCASLARRDGAALERAAGELAREVGELETAVAPQVGPALGRYLDFADSLDPGYRFAGTRIAGTIRAGGYWIGTILLLPPGDAGSAAAAVGAGAHTVQRPRGTILALHGYSSNSAFILAALERLADRGWAVLAADLPGHGYSDGPRGDIPDFAAYGEVAEDLLAWIEGQSRYPLPAPLVLLGYSAGGAALLETLWRGTPVSSRVGAAILVAPLLRPRGFSLRPLAYALEPLIPSLPRRDLIQGYLDLDWMPLHWVQALDRWNRTLAARPALAIPALIIQGRADQVVAWQKNLALLKTKLADCEIEFLDGRGHVLLSREPDRTKCIAVLGAFLDHRVVPGL